MPQENSAPRRDRHGRRDGAATTNSNVTGPRSTIRPSKTVGRPRGTQTDSLVVECQFRLKAELIFRSNVDPPVDDV
jgi:hypothetical protein